MKGGPKFFIFFSSIICSLLFIGLSIPLILGKIPPNDFYGIRLEATLESDDLWYETNVYGGWAMAIAGFLMLSCNSVLYFFRKKLNSRAYTGIFALIILACLFCASGITAWFVNT